MNHFETLKQFIDETGMEKGSVSCDMALRSLNAIEEELKITEKLLAVIPVCASHGRQRVPHAIEWLEQVKFFGKFVTEGLITHKGV